MAGRESVLLCLVCLVSENHGADIKSPFFYSIILRLVELACIRIIHVES